MNVQCNTGHALTWSTLPPLPDSTGFAGSFAGVADGVLIVAGGSNFPNGGAPWKGSTKHWYDNLFVLKQPDGPWQKAGHLPVPLGYGVSVSTSDGLVLIGGSNEQGHESRVWRLHYREGQIQTDTLPSLPVPLANSCGALVHHTIYVAGGLEAPDAVNTQPVFFSLDLTATDKGWQSLPAWPGPSRMLAVAGAAGGKFYLFSGAQLTDGVRHYLTDAYVYDPASGWDSLPALPQPVVAAPSPAWLSPAHQLLVFGGDDGVLAGSGANLQEQHPGFSNKILRFDIDRRQWLTGDTIYTRQEADKVAYPNNSIWAPVTTTMAVWENRLVFPGGEVRPATRTPNVLTATPPAQ